MHDRVRGGGGGGRVHDDRCYGNHDYEQRGDRVLEYDAGGYDYELLVLADEYDHFGELQADMDSQ